MDDAIAAVINELNVHPLTPFQSTLMYYNITLSYV